MKWSIGLGLIVVFAFSSVVSAKPAAVPGTPPVLTREELFKGSRVPERRAFPLSSKVKPCDDFHAYVCSEVESRFKMPADRSRWLFAFSDSSERILQAKKNFFKRLTSGYEPKLERTKNVQRLYKSCMNEEARKKEEKAFVDVQWDQIRTAKTNQALQELINARLFTPDFSLLAGSELANQADPERYDFTLLADSGGMTLPEKSFYEQKPAVDDLRKLAQVLFSELKIDQADKRAGAVVDFEIGLAKAYPTPAEMRVLSSSDTYMKRKDWIKAYPHFDLQRLFKKLPEGIPLRNMTKDALAYLNNYVDKASPFELQSVLLFESVKGVMDDAYPQYFKVYFEFQRKHYGGPEKRPARDERCTRLAMSELEMELDAELIGVLFPGFDSGQVRDTAEVIRQSIIRGLRRNTWLSETARKEAINKMTRANLKVVHPETDADWNFLPLRPLSEDRPIENEREISEARLDRMLERIRGKRNRAEWVMGPLVVNAYYQPEDNQFVLPQGILQYPFFSPDQSRIENLGAMGTVVGHELGHGVDDEGSKYDSAGKLRQWMTADDLKKFNEHGARLVDQFNKIGHDGKLTLGENIGDNVGLEFSLAAAFPEPDKADMKDVRKFFEAYSRVWCSVARPEMLKVLLKTDPHANPHARINQQVIHKDLFHKAYQCKAGDKMYLPPAERVKVW